MSQPPVLSGARLKRYALTVVIAFAAFFVLTRIPMAVCPFCDSEANWPDDLVLVETSGIGHALLVHPGVQGEVGADLALFLRGPVDGAQRFLALHLGGVPGLGRIREVVLGHDHAAQADARQQQRGRERQAQALEVIARELHEPSLLTAITLKRYPPQKMPRSSARHLHCYRLQSAPRLLCGRWKAAQLPKSQQSLASRNPQYATPYRALAHHFVAYFPNLSSTRSAA